jgi:hypothetical protein
LEERYWVRVELNSGSVSDDTGNVSLLLTLPVLEQVVILLDGSAMILGEVQYADFILVGLEVSNKTIVIAGSRNGLVDSLGRSEE